MLDVKPPGTLYFQPVCCLIDGRKQMAAISGSGLREKVIG
jgi:hypothetical protein